MRAGPPRHPHRSPSCAGAGAALVLVAWIALARSAGAAEWGQRFDFRQLQYTIRGSVPPSTAAKRIAWELRKRTSIEVLLEPTRVRLRDAELFNSPFLYWRGGEAFPMDPGGPP